MPTEVYWNSFLVPLWWSTGVQDTFTEGENFYEKDLFRVNFGNFSWLFRRLIHTLSSWGFLVPTARCVIISFNAKFSSNTSRVKYKEIVPGF